jgi:hypothetical protein
VAEKVTSIADVLVPRADDGSLRFRGAYLVAVR